jgi:hypothetical protein
VNRGGKSNDTVSPRFLGISSLNRWNFLFDVLINAKLFKSNARPDSL